MQQSPESLIKTIKAHIAKGDKAQDKAEQHYIAAGQHLKTLKAQHKGNWAEWEALLKERVGIGKSRASELMLIADGTKTLAEVRADTAKRTADAKTSLKSALKSSASSGEIRKPEFEISEIDGQYQVKIITEPVHHPDCHDPNCGICEHCGGKIVQHTLYKSLSAEDALCIIQAFTDPKSYEELREVQRISLGGMHHLRELAQFIVSHPYTDAKIAEWTERDLTEVKESRRWAKNGFKGPPSE